MKDELEKIIREENERLDEMYRYMRYQLQQSYYKYNESEWKTDLAEI